VRIGLRGELREVRELRRGKEEEEEEEKKEGVVKEKGRKEWERLRW
jgi:hypothetical protein